MHGLLPLNVKFLLEGEEEVGRYLSGDEPLLPCYCPATACQVMSPCCPATACQVMTLLLPCYCLSGDEPLPFQCATAPRVTAGR